MTLISTIIGDAFRESNLIAIGVDPTTAEITEALRVLNRYVSALVGNELGELLTDSSYGLNNVTRPNEDNYVLDDILASYYLPENTRIVTNLQGAKTVYLHPNPRDGARIGITDPSSNLATYNLIFNGNGRTIEDATSVTLATNGVDREWFYRADLGNWARISDLATSDQSPFPAAFDDLLIIGLAMRLNPRNGAAVDPQSIDTYKSQMKKFKSRYRQSKQMGVDTVLGRINDIYGTNYYGYSDNRSWDRGWSW